MPPKTQQLLKSKQSDVHAQDSSGNIYKGFQVWVALDKPGEDGRIFNKCVVLPGTTPEVFKLRCVEPPTDEEFTVPKSKAYNLNQNLDVMSFSDIGTLPHSNSPCVLDFLRSRFMQGQIYSTADPLIVAINPFKNLGNATNEVITQYRDIGDVAKLPPHVFAVARNALESLHMVRKSQTIIVSGESGAGKTEATKQVMRYFAAAKSGTMDLRIQTAILAANPVVEAFGNAKTVRNNNSSRFGRWIQLDVAATGGINFGSVKNFLLEKSRVLTQEKQERNYHIFYQLLVGATSDMKQKLKLLPIKEYNFINEHCLTADGIDDLEEWKLVEGSLDSMGLTPEQKFGVFSIVAGVLMMGNATIGAAELDGVPDAAVITEGTRKAFNDACELMFLDPELTEKGICRKISVAGGKEIHGRWSQKDGIIMKDSLCKAIYDKLFYWIIIKLNVNIEPANGWKSFMGILDIFGFEVFQNNSLEQLFINITNEMLQRNFTDVVFDKEAKLYREEGISSADLVFTSNKEVIAMLTDKKSSLMAALDDQCLAPSGSDEKFLSNAHNMLKGNPKLIKPKVANNINFLVDHTIGEIQYNVTGFLSKNKDVLRPDLVAVCQASSNEVCSGMFAGVVVEKGRMKGDYIGAQYMKQLDELMTMINSTEAHFIRCVKPNEVKKPLVFDQAKTLVQLHALSILEALQLRNLGYSYRRPFEDFLFQFRFIDLSISQNEKLDPADAARQLLKVAGIDSGWQVGKSMLFMRPNTAKAMVVKQRDAMTTWKPLCALVEALFIALDERRRIAKLEVPLKRLQAHCRRKLAGKVAAPSYQQPLRGW